MGIPPLIFKTVSCPGGIRYLAGFLVNCRLALHPLSTDMALPALVGTAAAEEDMGTAVGTVLAEEDVSGAPRSGRRRADNQPKSRTRKKSKREQTEAREEALHALLSLQTLVELGSESLGSESDMDIN